MYLNISISPATRSPVRRARLSLEFKATPWERCELFTRGYLNQVIVPAAYAGRDLAIADLIDSTACITARTTAMANAIADLARARARAVADNFPAARTAMEVGHV